MAFSTHERSKLKSTDIWLTPPNLHKKLGLFDLDPCAAPLPRPWATAQTMWGENERDGLAEAWFGRVWLNPPYSSIAPWMEKLAAHGNGMALVFTRTDTRWFQNFVFPHIHGLFFFRGRLCFCDRFGKPAAAAAAAGAPSVLLAYGESNASVLKSLDWPGEFLPGKRGAF